MGMEKTATINGTPLPIRFQTVLRASSRPLVRFPRVSGSVLADPELNRGSGFILANPAPRFVEVSAICDRAKPPSILSVQLRPLAIRCHNPFLFNVQNLY